jgi:hypothetical protein
VQRAKSGLMREHEASRTLVKSPPELWAECSDAASLARHLGRFGEIRITRLEPETAVAWEGERGSGTVRIEPSGWGTKVILTAVSSEEVAADGTDPMPGDGAASEDLNPPETAAVAPEPPLVAIETPDPEPAGLAGAVPERRRRFARLRRFLRGDEHPAAVPPADEPPADPEPDPPAVDAPTEAQAPPVTATEAALTAALDSLGQAHHRPYSRG